MVWYYMLACHPDHLGLWKELFWGKITEVRDAKCANQVRKTPTTNNQKTGVPSLSLSSLSGLKRLSIMLILPLFLLHHDHDDHHDHHDHDHDYHHCHVSSGSLRSEITDVDAGKVAEVNGAL